MRVIGFLMLLIACYEAGASTNQNAMSIRKEKNIGVSIGFNNPYPSLLGMNVSYNITENSRASIGHSEVKVTSSVGFNGTEVASSESKLTTYAAGYDHFFTDWAFRPSAGLHVASLNFSGDDGLEVQGFNKSTTVAYTKLGFDYQGSSGFQFGIGTNLAFTGKSGGSGYIAAGWFF